MTTPNSQAIAIANNLLAAGQQLYALNALIGQYNTQFTQLTLGTTLNAMATCVTGTDGSLGAADGTPNTAHVIDTRVVTGLSRAISATDLAGLNTLLGAVAQLLSGGTPPTQQGQAPQLLNKIVGG